MELKYLSFHLTSELLSSFSGFFCLFGLNRSLDFFHTHTFLSLFNALDFKFFAVVVVMGIGCLVVSFFFF